MAFELCEKITSCEKHFLVKTIKKNICALQKQVPNIQYLRYILESDERKLFVENFYLVLIDIFKIWVSSLEMYGEFRLREGAPSLKALIKINRFVSIWKNGIQR